MISVEMLQGTPLGVDGWATKSMAPSPDTDVLARLADSQEVIARHLTRSSTGSVGDSCLGLLGGASPADQARLPGVRGAASWELLRQYYGNHAGAYASAVRTNIRAARASAVGDLDPRLDSAREFVHDMPLANMRTNIHFMVILAGTFDLMKDGRWEEAEDMVARGLVVGEQASLNFNDWNLAWLLGFLPPPPYHRMSHAPRRDAQRPFASLARPEWSTAGMAYLKDIRAFNEDQSKNTGGAPPHTPAGTPKPGETAEPKVTGRRRTRPKRVPAPP